MADEVARRRTEGLQRVSNMAAVEHMTFETFHIDAPGNAPDQVRSLRTAHEAARRFAERPEGWLVLHGGYGCGKTHLAAAIVNDRIAAGQPALFVVVPDLLDHLRAAFAPGAETTFDERFDAVRDAPLLVLDDLGTQAPTAWASEKLFQILNHRYNAQLPTVITTNVALEELDDRLRSRLGHTGFVRPFDITALDYRGGVHPEGVEVSTLHHYADQAFQTWDHRSSELPAEEARNLRRAFDLARGYAESPDGWLVFTGDHGCGKTHLAAAIANQRSAMGHAALFVVVPDLLDHLRATFSPTSRVQYDKRFDEVRGAPLLVLDDLGTESATPWAQEKLFQILEPPLRCSAAHRHHHEHAVARRSSAPPQPHAGSGPLHGVRAGGAGVPRPPHQGPHEPTRRVKILILKPCCLGDVLLATPLAAVLSAAWPAAVIDWAIDGHSFPALANNPHVAGRLDATGCVRGAWRPGGLLRLFLAIRRGRYDVAFIPERSPLMAWLPALAGVPRRVGLDSGGRGRRHTVRVPVPAMRHEAELYLDLVRAVGIEPGPPQLVFRPTRDDQLCARRCLAGLLTAGAPVDLREPLPVDPVDGASVELPDRAPPAAPRGGMPPVDPPDGAPQPPPGAGSGALVAVHLGGGVNPGMTLAEKRWPPERWAELLGRLHAAGERLVVLGGPADLDYVRATLSRTAAPVLNLAGQLTLGETAAVLEQADLYVGHDTGVSHLATAVGAPAVVIFGPTDPRRYGPLPGTGIAVAPPAGAVDQLEAARGSTAIQAVSVDAVWRACQELQSGGL